MKRLVLVRHGETVWHAENRYTGASDIALADKGLSQAQRLAMWSRNAGLHAVWSSSLSRARMTAQPSADTLAMTLQVEPRLVELDFGEAEGLTPQQMEERFPERRRAFLADPATNYLPGGENPTAAVERGMQALHGIAGALPWDGRALIVAHNTLIRLLLCHVLGIPLCRYRTVFPRLANATITEVGIHDAGDIALLVFNAPLQLNTDQAPTAGA